jgi:acyl-CoA dehydrogenase family protein 9
VADYVVRRVAREVRPDKVTQAHADLAALAAPIGEQVSRMRDEGEKLLRRYGKGIAERGLEHKRYAHALMDLYAQIAVISRVSSIFDDQGVEASGQERFIAETFCTRAARRVHGALDQLWRNDDDRVHSIARLAYKRGSYGYALFED